MLVKQTSDRKVYTTNYNNNIYLDIYINYLHLDFDISETGISNSEIRS